eukprot:gene4425-4679_t
MRQSAKLSAPGPARIAVLGAGWWSQGWHLPQMQRNPNVEISAIMESPAGPPALQRNEQPTAWTGPRLDSRKQLAHKYSVPVFSSCEEMLADTEAMANTDGVVICTSHHAHASLGAAFLEAGKHVLMEKPMTVDVPEAVALAVSAEEAAKAGRVFMVNNSANFRDQCFEARSLVESGK